MALSIDAAVGCFPIELAVGRDLHFIRINGTIMGALVGLILYLIGLAL